MKKRFTSPFSVNSFYPLASVLMFALVLPAASQAVTLGGKIEITEYTVQNQVSGTVSSASGPVAGVTVYIKEDSSIATTTDEDGHFSISASVGQTLVFSGIGYDEYEQTVSGISMHVILELSNEAIDEVVVVGYGTQRRESLTGSLSTVKGEELRDVTTPNVTTMLAGKAPGVFVSPGSGQPGSGAAVMIRGQATLGGTTAPLWVIDGVIVGSSPGSLNPEDVENMTVLKDAASTAIYGSQGANGVIVITTKRGKSGETTVNFSTRTGFNQLTNGNMQVMNGEELYDYFASFGDANSISFPRWNADLRNSNFDWWDLATQSGFNQNHNLTIQGGTEKLQSLLSVGYYDEAGAVKGYNYDRYNVRFNATYKPVDWLTIRPTIYGARTGTFNQQYSVTAMYSNLPWDSPFDEDGNLVPHRYSGWVNNASTNYLYDLQWDKSGSSNYEIMGNFDFDIRLTDYLTFSSVNNYRVLLGSSSGYTDPRSNGGLSVNGRLTEWRDETSRRYTSQIIRFDNGWGKHHVNALAAYEFNDYRYKSLDVYGTGFLPGFEVLDVVTTPERTRGGISEWAVQSVLFNGHYAYDNKYLAQVSLRRDGASNFGDNAKYGNFWSVSAGWNINHENWFNADYVDILKLRAAIGTVGNRPSALYPQYDLYAVSADASYDGAPGTLISQIGIRDLTWEQTLTKGIGVDGALFGNRARFSADYYIKETDNMLYNVPISGLTGVTSIYRNIGSMQNRGIEFSVGGDIIRNEDLTWSLDVNIGRNINKLVDLFETRNADGTYSVKPIIRGAGLNIAGSAETILDPGHPVDTWYLREWAGVNPEDGRPMWYVVDRDENGNEISRETTSTYADATFEKTGWSTPDLFGGIMTSLSYKRFDMAANFGYSIGGQIYNYARQEYDSDGTYTDRNQMRLRPEWSRWEQPGDIATHPRAMYNNEDQGNQVSSRYLEDGSFFRLRSLTLGYSFDMSQYNIRGLRVFAAGENLFVLTKYSGVDPEIPPSGSTVLSATGPGVYPMTKKFILGLNVSF